MSNRVNGMTILLGGMTAAFAQTVFGAQLPIPCVAGACGASGPTSLAAPGTATAVQNGNTLAITQKTSNAILNWASFDISANGKVTFQQPSSTSIALNRIFEGNPSTIFGQITANGQIYLINPNGFIFGASSQVNAAGLIASSLGISDSTFNQGILSPSLLAQGLPALASNPVLGTDGKPLPVQITIANGAQLSTPGGRLLVAAPTVLNSGSLSASDGQVIVAAGQQVFLQASTDPNLRGLVVEVDQGGTAWNQLTGQISSARGNVTMVGLAVNQDGRISATTSVSANGSVRLEAGDTTSIQSNGAGLYAITSTNGGTLTLGPQSSIQVLPELASTATAVADQAQPQSQVKLLGEQIFMDGGSIEAPSGIVTATAAANPGLGIQTDGNANAQIRVDAGTTIDVSGSNAEVPITANLLAIQLRANELADDPAQRNGALRSQTVYVDARVGSPLISAPALAAAIAAVPETIAQRTTAGGTVTLQSEGDVVVQPGSTINVSGGQTTYDGGIFQTSYLVGQNGSLYSIGTANPLLPYSGVVNPAFTQTFNSWGVSTIVNVPGLSNYEAGYVEGASAGSVNIAAPSILLQGSLLGHVVNGALQRSGSSVAQGGQLVIGLPAGLASNPNQNTTDFLAPNVSFAAQPTPIVVADGSPLPVQTLQLSPDYLTAGGFTHTSIYSNGTVTVPSGLPLNLNPGGSLTVEAARIDVDSSLTAPGGSIVLQNALTIDVGALGAPRPGIDIGNDVQLDVRGQWTNDTQSSSAPATLVGQTLQNGGTIDLAAGIVGSELVIGSDVALRASGGAWLQSNGTITGGTGGKITLQSGPLDSALQLGQNIALEAFGVNGATGGSFSLTAPRISIDNGNGNWSVAQRVDDTTSPGGVIDVGASLFNQYGFSNVSLTANGAVASGANSTDILTVQAGTALTAQTTTLELQPGYQYLASAPNAASLTQTILLPAGTRPVTDVTLNVTPQSKDNSLLDVGLLDVQKGASITTDPGGAITMNGVGGILVDGSLNAPGGTITLHIPSPNPSPDPGYLPNQAIEIGPQGILNADGTFIPTPNTQGLALGTVLPGGSINLQAERGSVIAVAGSQIDVAGTSAQVDVPNSLAGSNYTLYTVPSAGGSLLVQAPESISLRGTLAGAAGLGNYGNPAAASLEVDLTRSEYFTPAPDSAPGTFPTTPRVIELVADTSGMPVSSPDSGLALLGVTQLQSAGFDSLRLEAGNEILFGSNTPLNLAQQAIFDAPAIAVAPGVSASVTTNYAYLGNSLPAASTAVASPGTGTLAINAQQIDLVGNFVLQNIASAQLTSSGAITLKGSFVGSAPTGNLTLDGNLTLSAALVYPATDTSFTIDTVHAATDPSTALDTVAINPLPVVSGTTPTSLGTPLSAGGTLSISADVIAIAGTVKAPFGSIDLNALTSISLGSDAQLSVSGAGLTIPYGSTQLGGLQWTYTPVGGDTQTITGIPQRAVSLVAPNVSVAPGATINLSGGGDLYAYEWVPGTGGTTDALGQVTASGTNTGAPTTPGLYAVLPSERGQYAPYDPQETPAAGLAPGASGTGGANLYNSVYLSGGGGLAAGVYPLLPARDALLPGAYLVQVQTSGYNNIVPGEQAYLADSTPVVAGYLTFGTTGLHSGGYQGIAIYPGSYAQSLAQYSINDASTYFASTTSGQPTPNLPADAGSLSVAVTNSLQFLGNIQGNLAGSTGLSSQIDISASTLEVTGTNPPAAVPGTVTIAGSVIQGWQAGELVLGGHPTNGGSLIDVTANTVTVDSGAQLNANQVVIVANQGIDIQSGAVVSSTSATAGGKAPAALPVESNVTLTSTNAAGAALLAVSDLSLPVVQTSGSGAGGATISVAQGASVNSLGALSLNGPGGVTLAGSLNGVGANWSLASSSIGFVGASSSTDALQIDNALVGQLNRAGAVQLSSQGAINLYVPVLLGTSAQTATPSLSSLTLTATGIVNQGGASGSTFGAKLVTVDGTSGGSVQEAGVGATGSLGFVANEFDLGSGSLAISGFTDTTIAANAAIVGRAVGSLVTSGDLNLTTPVVTVVSGAQAQFSAPNGTLTIAHPSAGAQPLPTLVDPLGGEIDLQAANIVQSGTLTAPAGIVSLQATNAIDLSSSAVVDVGGKTLTIAGQTVGAEGGAIAISAGTDLTIASGALVNVSGAGDAPAGSVALVAGGAANLSGTMTGQAGTGAQGGSFSLDAGSLTQGLTPLAASLFGGGFTNSDSVRARTGNLMLGAGAQIDANQVTVTADTGTVDIAGTVDAPGASLRGEIALFGGQGVIVDATGQLHADSAGGTGIGGNIELGSAGNGAITLADGAVISATGSSTNGQLLIRSPLLGNTVAISNQGANLGGLGQILVEPIITLPIDTAPTAADFAQINSTITADMSTAQPAILAALNPAGTLPLVVRPAVDLDQAGSVTLASSLNLSTWRYDGQPVDMTFRVGGSITVNGTLSDGFSVTKATHAKPSVISMLDGPSADLRLVAGADLTSADPLAVVAGSGADLTLGTATGGGIVRTGTGEIDLVASQDVVFAGPGASVYTAGTPGAASFQVPHTNSYFNFPTNGGNLVISAGQDVVGAPVSQSVSAWQIRQGDGASNPLQWGVDFSQFGWNAATLGGGDVIVNAGGSISNLSAAAADTYANTATATNAPAYFPSGGFAVTAGGDIASSQFFIAQGQSLLRAGGGFTATRMVANSETPTGSLIALGDAQVTLEARSGIVLDAAVDPTIVVQGATDAFGALSSYFFTYGSDSRLTLQATSGDVNLNYDSSHLVALAGSEGNGPGLGEGLIYPSTFIARSLQQDINLALASLYPSDNGQLELIAGGNIEGANAVLTMSDAPQSIVPTIQAPSASQPSTAVIEPFGSGRHSDDPQPAIVAAGGNIDNLFLQVPKQTDIAAAGNITNLTFYGQNINPSDLTLISAGGTLTDGLTGGSGAAIEVGGPGRLDVLAGGTVNLGLSQGIATVGALVNPNLPTSAGADLTVMAGLAGQAFNYNAFVASLGTSAALANPSPAVVLAYVQAYVPGEANNTELTAAAAAQLFDSKYSPQALITSFVETQTGQSNLSFTQAEAIFATLSDTIRRPLINQIFFEELALSGLEANIVASAGASRGYAAVDGLFPNSRSASATAPSPYSGDISLTFSRIYTLSGGTISLIAPGGSVDVGLANPPASLAETRSPSQLGIVAEGTGDVDIYTQGDVNVNASRIFTLGGGNILVWSDEGSIDAGKGAKSSVSAPPPIVTVDSSGNVTLDFSGAVAGSGIRTIQVDPNTPPGNVELVAPSGTVNAGDAGIFSAGGLFVYTPVFIGASNTGAGGPVVGVPAAVSNIGVTLSGASSTASSATNSSTADVAKGADSAAASPLAQNAISWLDVFVTGLGEENCKPDDMECLKHQKPGSQ